jgi:hypothetical protein
VSPPDWGDARVNTFRTLLSHEDRLYAAPTGRTTGYGQADETVPGVAVIYECTDPARGEWRAVCEPGFGDPENTTVFELVAFNGTLYAGTMNPKSGLQVWKRESAAGGGRDRWRPVLRDGAGRGPLNELCVSMCVFGDSMYVGTGIVKGGYDRQRGIGPAAPEILRVNADDSWDIIVGGARQCYGCPKEPLSGYGAGFDNPFSGYVWRMAVHDDYLYAGTYDWGVLLPYLDRTNWPSRFGHFVQRLGIEHIGNIMGGGELWRTKDGSHWVPVTLDGFGNKYNWGIRTMEPTPVGLMVGTANPFGPNIAVPTGKEWVYRDNPRGGLEIWRVAEMERRARSR